MRIIGRPRALFALFAAVFLLAGCGTGPSKVNSAVITNGKSVSVNDIQGKLDRTLATNGFAKQLAQQHKLDLLSREIVTREVLYQATDRAAQREGLRVNDQDLVAQVAQRNAQQANPQSMATDDINGQLTQAADAAFDTDEVVRAEMLQTQLGARYLQRLSITFDGALVDGGDTKTKAQQLASQLAADPAKSGQLINSVGQDGGRALPNQPLSLVSGLLVSEEFELSSSSLFSVKPGTVVAFPVSSQSGGSVSQSGGSTAWLVALVTQRNENAPLSDKEAQVLPQIPDTLVGKIGQRLAGKYVDDLGLQLSPRYGVWDPVGNAVAPRTQEAVGYLYPPHTAQQQ
jgi:hypothetical protein